MTQNNCVLLLANDDYEAAVTRELVERCCIPSHPVERIKTVQEAREKIRRRRYAAAIIDLNVSDASGLDTVREIVQANAETPIIALGAQGDDSLALDALRLGIQEYLPKSSLDSRTLQRALQHAKMRKVIECELLAKAFSDRLTGLSNRALLNDRWQRSLARSARASRNVGVLIIDVDRFKLINDTHGHAAGDAVLQHLAQTLTKSVRRSDVIARIGGDEIIIVLECIKNIEDIVAVREKLQVQYSCNYGADNQCVTYSVNIGVSISDPDLQEGLLNVLQRADIELRENKAYASGRRLLEVA